MRIVITGGAGYLGTRMAHRLLQRGHLVNRAGAIKPIERITIYDLADPPNLTDPRIEFVRGSIIDSAALNEVLGLDEVSVFHLAAVLPGVTERDLGRGLAVNVDGTRNVLQAMADNPRAGKVIMTSSVTVYRRTPGDDLLDENCAVQPATVYGITKVIAEQLAAAFNRGGGTDARCARLSTVIVRPKAAGTSAGGSISDIIRELGSGRPCQVLAEPDLRVSVIDYDSCIDGLLRLHDLDAEALDGRPVLDFPGLTLSIEALIEAGRAAARQRGLAPGTPIFAVNDFVQQTLSAWPSAVDASRAQQLGITCRTDIGEIAQRFFDDYDSFWPSRT